MKPELKLIEGAMATALEAADNVLHAAALLNQGRSCIEEAGRLLHGARQVLGAEYRAHLHKHKIAERTAQRAIQFYLHPEKALEHRAKDRAYQAARPVRRASDSDADPPSEIKEDVETEPTAKQYQEAMCQHAYEALQLAQVNYEAPVTDMVLRMVRETAQAWNDLLQQLEVKHESSR